MADQFSRLHTNLKGETNFKFITPLRGDLVYIETENLKTELLRYSPKNFQKEVQIGIQIAEKYHEGQLRYSGEPYLNHSLRTALTLAKMEMSANTIIGGLLQSLISNSSLKGEEIKTEISSKLGEDILELLDAVSYINKATASTDTQYEIVTKYILNQSNDLRPIFIKLAGTLDNVRTIEYMPQEQLNNKLQKIFNIYTPLAEYLSLDELKKELEEKAFQIYRPEDYQIIEDALKKQGLTEETKEEYSRYLSTLLKEFNPKIGIYGRVKSKYSIYNKLKKLLKEGSSLKLDSIRDIIAFRLVMNSEEDCFKALELLMDHGEILDEEFDDYMSHPKPNGYKALQGPVILKDVSDNVLEVQILTKEMYYYNTYGPASHIAYKESKSRYAKPTDKYNWVEDIHNEINRNIDERELKASTPIKANIFQDYVYAFTPKGKIIQLDKGDTVLDFAFRVHSDVGYSMVSAKVNGKPVKLDYQVQTRDTVEIKTQLNKKTIKPEWIKYANSTSTKSKIQKSWKKF